MRSLLAVLCMSLVALVGCSRSGTQDVVGGGDGSTAIAVSFAADNPTPGPNTVALASGGSSGNVVGVLINVSGVNDVVGGSFDLVYDPALVEFLNWDRGALLGSDSTVLVDASTPGVLVVGAARNGGIGQDVSGVATLLRMDFRALAPGTSQLVFEASALTDDTPPNGQEITGLTWSGGTLLAD